MNNRIRIDRVVMFMDLAGSILSGKVAILVVGAGLRPPAVDFTS